jgi:hypothetical protein
MKNNYLVVLLIFISSVCFAGGPEPEVFIDSGEIADGSVTPAKLDSAGDYSVNSMTLADKVQAAWADIRGDIYASGSLEIVGDANIGGDLTGVNASFTGAVEATGRSVLKHPFSGNFSGQYTIDSSITSNGIYDTGIAVNTFSTCGHFYFTSGSDTLGAVIRVVGGNVTKVEGDASVTTAIGTGNSVNIYKNASDKLVIQNTTAGTRTIRALWVGIASSID